MDEARFPEIALGREGPFALSNDDKEAKQID
jgi:hypothetical protein